MSLSSEEILESDRWLMVCRSTDSPTGTHLSPFRQWLKGSEPWWANGEDEHPLHAHSDMAESEADTSTDTASVSPDGLQHSASGKGPYYYIVVSCPLTVCT